MSKIIGIVGTRARDTQADLLEVATAFDSVYVPGDWICSGGCPKGGDRFAVIIHKQRAIPYLEFPADWDRHGKAAGHIRNADIAKYSDILIACVPPTSVLHGGTRSGGAESTVNLFVKAHPTGKVILV